MTPRSLAALATVLLLGAGACGGDDEPTGSIDDWCALGPTLDDVRIAIGSADFTDPVALEGALSTLADSLDEMEDAAPEEISEEVASFVAGNRDFIAEFDEVGYEATRIDAAGAARAVERYSAVAVDLDAFTAARCDDPFLLADSPADVSGTPPGEADDDSGDDGAAAGTPDDDGATVAATTELELLDAGESDDRVRLDAVPAAGDTWSGEMLVDVGLGVNGEMTDSPTSIVEMVMEVVDVAADGSFTMRSEVTGVRTYRADTYDPADLAAYEPRARTMVGTSSTWTVDASGNAGAVTSEFPDDLDPTLSEGLQIGDRASDQMSVPLPDQPVGVGATWRTRQVTDFEGVQATLVTDYELVEVDGEVFRLESTTSQTLSVAAGEVTGTGSLRQRIGGLAPIESTAETDGTYEVEEEDGSVTSLRLTTFATVTQLD